ncbi:hypothetical protein CPB83DRAFT_833574 [Crepidotus variabilis]|uniref:Uncharacterized protein n=1 Tax=Crepidotus variabilis TaxID=179855 RepID=A0A9P6JT42_9AGAR|nr:hypothetical protein CPB83DRAFT_833574 [Crepidotus variabilis]
MREIIHNFSTVAQSTLGERCEVGMVSQNGSPHACLCKFCPSRKRVYTTYSFRAFDGIRIVVVALSRRVTHPPPLPSFTPLFPPLLYSIKILQSTGPITWPKNKMSSIHYIPNNCLQTILNIGASMIVNFPEAFIHLPKTFRVVLRHMFKGQKSFLNESEKGRKKIEALGTSTIYVFALQAAPRTALSEAPMLLLALGGL